MLDLSSVWSAFNDWLAALNPLWIFVSGAIFANLRLILGAFNALSLHAFRILRGFHLRAYDPNILNINRDIVRADSYAIDCLLADRILTEVIKNHFYAFRLSLAARLCTEADPVVRLPRRRRYLGLFGPLTSAEAQERAYRRIYGPVRSVIREKMSLTGSDYAMLGYPVEQHRLVVALAFEPDLPLADRHWRVFVVWEEALRTLPETCPPVQDPRLVHRFETLKKIRDVYLSNNPQDTYRLTSVTHWIVPPAALSASLGAPETIAIDGHP
jgi:hypothetical protein